MTKMTNLVQRIYDTYDDKPVSSKHKKKDSYLNPSSSGVVLADGTTLGACSKKVWLEKKGFPVSNPTTVYNKLQFDWGNMIEDWVVDKFKLAGLYVDSSVYMADNDLKLSGEIDAIINTSNGLEAVEIKTYNGSSQYAANEVLGTKDKAPQPKDAYVLQCVSYLLMLRHTDIKRVNLLYIDKSVGKVYNHKQFGISLRGDRIVYEQVYKNEAIVTLEDRYTVQDVLDRNRILTRMIEDDECPEPGYKMVYSDSEALSAYNRGLITKYKYDQYVRSGVPCGDYMCSYCPYGVGPEGLSTCVEITNDTKDMFMQAMNT